MMPFLIVPNAVVIGSPPSLPGPARFGLDLDPSGAIVRLTFTDDPNIPAVGVLAYVPATTTSAGLILLELARLGRTDGAPGEWFRLPGQMVAGDELEVFTLEGLPTQSIWQQWEVRPDWGASRGRDRHVVLDRPANRIVFPDGDRGHIPTGGSHVVVRVLSTAGQAANSAEVRSIALPPTLRNWALIRPDDLTTKLTTLGIRALFEHDREQVWEELSPETYAAAVAAMEGLAAAVPPAGGAPAETVAQAAARAVADLAAPTRAITAPDFETLALATPGTRIARVRALPRQHPAMPCMVAPGVVTVVIVPAQRRAKPLPSPGLLTTVRDYLERRRLVGTRVMVVGPTYLTVGVTARVRVRPGASPDRVRTDVDAALRAFLDPLIGGPTAIAATASRTVPESLVSTAISSQPDADTVPALALLPPGWPFGRDVFRTEILQVIDGVAGVDHVLSMELSGDGGAPQCGNLCVGPTQLVTAGVLVIEVVR
jgi:Baseplate J-like protein